MIVKQSEKKLKRGANLPIPGPGRKKGVPNRFTSLKQSFLDAFKETGGTQGLIDWIEKNPRNRGEFYKMVTKLLPSSITGGEDKEGRPLPIRLLIENADTNTGKS